MSVSRSAGNRVLQRVQNHHNSQMTRAEIWNESRVDLDRSLAANSILTISCCNFLFSLNPAKIKIAVETVEKHEVIRGICRLIDYAVLFWVAGWLFLTFPDSSLYFLVFWFSLSSTVLVLSPARRGCGVALLIWNSVTEYILLLFQISDHPRVDLQSSAWIQ